MNTKSLGSKFKELEQENITVDLSLEEIKNLQSVLQKDPSKRPQNLLERLEGLKTY